MNQSQSQNDFANVVGQFINASGYNICQLARLSGLPRMTLVNWLDGVTRKPRSWQDIAKLAQALKLDGQQTDALLLAAHYPALSQLRTQVQTEADQHLLTFWQPQATAPARSAPFLAIPNLPTFVGRAETLHTIERWLTTEQPGKTIILEGMAGAGKTALATRLAYQHRHLWPDGVLWARPDTTPTMTILHLFADVYGRNVAAYDDLDSRSAYVRHLLAEKRVLIVLDNVSSQEQIQPLLPPSGTCAVLITTRRRDLSLPTATPLYVEPFTKRESLALFAQVLGEERVTNERSQLAQIGEIVGHLPLAVDILACRLMVEPHLTTAVCLTELQTANTLLDHLNHQDRCVRAAFVTTIAHLTPEQRHLFASLGMIKGFDFSIHVAAAAAKTSASSAATHLTSLFCASLVRRSHAGHYRLTPMLHTLAKELCNRQKVSGMSEV